ncbi:MAG: hypothetical protein ACP6IQ_04620 [Candidatus Njordarchaeia archaeon]|nr:hypothetical protein [Candidatus Korarchaeota archaeon]
MIDFKSELHRKYLEYLLTDVNVIPIENLELNILNKKIVLNQGESIKIPLWLAKILEKERKIVFQQERKPKELVGFLQYAIAEHRSTIEPEEDLYFLMREFLEELDDEKIRENVRNLLKNYSKVRMVKMLRSAILGTEKEPILWEDLLVKIIKKYFDEWLNALLYEKLNNL